MPERTLLIHRDITALADFVRNHHADFPTVIATNLLSMRFVRKEAAAGLRTTTLKQLSQRMLAGQGIRVMSEFERRKVLQQVLENIPLKYLPFNRPTLRQLSSIFSELMHAAIPPEKPLLVARTAREQDVAHCYQAYLTHLKAHLLADPAAVEFFALSCPAEPAAFLVYGYPYFDRAQLELLNRVCAAGSVITLTSEKHRVLRKASASQHELERLGWKVKQAANSSRQTVGTQAVHHLLEGQGPVPEGITHTALSSPETEVQQVFGHVHQLLLRGVLPEDVVVVVRDQDTYLPLVREASRRLQLPILCGQMLPLSYTHPARLVLSLIRANQKHWEHHAALEVLQHPLSRFADEINLKRKSLKVPPQRLQDWKLGEDARVLLLPAQASGASYGDLIREALAFLGLGHTVRGTHQTAMAVSRVLDILQSLSMLEKLTLEELRLELLEDFMDVGVPTVYSQRGVRIASPLALSGRKYQQVFVLGLSDTLFPQRPGADVLLDDHIRERWERSGVALVRQGERMHTERAYLHACLNTAIAKLHLSRPLFDLQGRALDPSPLCRNFQSAPALQEAVAATEMEAGLQGRVEESVQLRAKLELSRQKLHTSPHHGQVHWTVPKNHVWSPSQLVKFGNCRFQWLAEKALKLLPFPEVEKNLQRSTQGTFYHKVLEELLRPHVGTHPDAETLLAELPAAFERAEKNLLDTGELPPLPHWAFQRLELQQNLQNFVKSPFFLFQGSVPQQLEVHIEHTLHLQNGPFTFRGIVDRIEQTGQGTTVVDYKSRGYISEVRKADGSKLEVQLPLYLMAVNGQLGRYLSILNREKHLLRSVGPASADRGYSWESHQQEVLDFLENTATSVDQGEFPPTPGEGTCTLCDYGALCRVKARQA
ncbi:PD-(D/E)XK nuclease family protein [Deinococcus roseus]|uniref:PD-(D/E)XK endonuclease-like domain-containing protein n=1 Tax=Deinococcus roseus TaxID=392414 RepID=A0ABQ2CZJ1_9DEIO|nr:PD-(D/E)XK nuclease family protein [Deinococcus roseus]GGJ36244.1 hypothetical protein GCM10008938_22930 [Deinococcus roseus]